MLYRASFRVLLQAPRLLLQYKISMDSVDARDIAILTSTRVTRTGCVYNLFRLISNTPNTIQFIIKQLQMVKLSGHASS